MNSKILVVFALLGVLGFGFSAVNTEACEVCEDVVNTFGPLESNPTQVVSWLEDVYLDETNTITLRGYDSHGLRSLKIECTLLCGKENQP
ncbi:MAG: hypothetical protein KAS32_10415, partial [Candidatus Peribacteraceae bacterium]|nr:hypothetical protein [Candidatus Peribacteraceae bacterium]